MTTNPMLVLTGSSSTTAASDASLFTEQVSTLQEVQELRQRDKARDQEMRLRDKAREQEMERRDAAREEGRRIEKEAFERQMTEVQDMVKQSLSPFPRLPRK